MSSHATPVPMTSTACAAVRRGEVAGGQVDLAPFLFSAMLCGETPSAVCFEVE